MSYIIMICLSVNQRKSFIDSLSMQVCSPVGWIETMQNALRIENITDVIEVGPGDMFYKD